MLYEKGLVEIKKDAAWPTPVRFLNEAEGHPLQDIWAYQPYTEGTVYGTKYGIDEDVKWLGPTDPERLSYQTQKPLGLLGRIIRSSCPDGGLVLDPFCGCGTTVTTAQELRLRWIGIDVTNLAITLIRHRLRDTYGDDIEQTYEVIGEPVSVSDAEALAAADPYQFQWWALAWWVLDRLKARRARTRASTGGSTSTMATPRRRNRLSSRSRPGKLHAPYVRDLRGVVEREQAALGVLLTLNAPTKPMRTEAASAGFYASPWGQHPRVQILTVGELPGRKEAESAAAAPDQPDLQAGTEALKKAGEQTGMFGDG